ncbi:MAG: GTP 3',8-cyclase MoaA, partial [Candidatus Hydrogenedentes bacterium]|nr:GTP 3',8-cyclase MoaA [Candidatus Hydrogenedentota bacterium]
LRLSVTDRCNLRCRYCMPASGLPKVRHDDLPSIEKLVHAIRWLARECAVDRGHITGGEPLVRSGIEGLIRMLACEGVTDLALTTNGQLLAGVAAALKQAGLHRVNVSLDSLDSKTYADLTRGGDLLKVLQGIDAALCHGLAPVKINTVVLRGYNDGEVVELARFALRRGCQIRFLELMPIGCAKSLFHDLFVPSGEVRASLERSFSLRPLLHTPGASSRDFIAVDHDGQEGIIGFISPTTQPFCAGCTRVRLTSTGRIISCLARGDELHVGSFLRLPFPQAALRLREAVTAVLDSKTRRSTFDTSRSMTSVGG